MKIAILISGLTRDYEKTYSNLKEQLLDKYECDIFISTWDIIGCYNLHRNKNYTNNVNWCNIKNKLNISNFIEKYNPKKINIENYDNWEIKITPEINNFLNYYNFTSFTKNLNSLFAQWYKIKDVFTIFENYCNENNKNYDIIIKLRFDVFFKLPDLNTINNDNIYFLNKWRENTPQDYIFFSKNLINIKKLFLLYNFIINRNNNLNHSKFNIQKQGNTGATSELILYHFIIDNNIKHKILNFNTSLSTGI